VILIILLIFSPVIILAILLAFDYICQIPEKIKFRLYVATFYNDKYKEINDVSNRLAKSIEVLKDNQNIIIEVAKKSYKERFLKLHVYATQEEITNIAIQKDSLIYMIQEKIKEEINYELINNIKPFKIEMEIKEKKW
jgi:hypothetical protein